MVIKNDLTTAAEQIDAALQEFTRQLEAALQEFVHHRKEAKTLVFADRYGHLQAVVATHGFEGMPNDERVRRVWEHLRNTLPTKELGYLYGVLAFSADEYDARIPSSIVNGGDLTQLFDLDQSE